MSTDATRWVLLRHGESTANRDGVYSGWADVPLTERGRSQAREAGAALRDEPFAQAVSSDLVRAVETARLALGQRASPPLVQLRGLRERHLGAWQGQDRRQLKATGATDVLLTWAGAAPGGESLGQLAHRVVDTLAALPVAVGPTLLVAHGGVIRVLVGLLDGTPPDRLWDQDIPNAVPIAVTVPPGTWARIRAALPPLRGEP